MKDFLSFLSRLKFTGFSKLIAAIISIGCVIYKIFQVEIKNPIIKDIYIQNNEAIMLIADAIGLLAVSFLVEKDAIVDSAPKRRIKNILDTKPNLSRDRLLKYGLLE